MCSFFMQKTLSRKVIHKLKIFQISVDRLLKWADLHSYPPD